MKIAATLEYDGTKFSGFQRQNNAITIQEHLEDALNKITNENIVINYSGRTDAGVHAISQVFDFETNIHREDSSWINGINSNLLILPTESGFGFTPTNHKICASDSP